MTDALAVWVSRGAEDGP